MTPSPPTDRDTTPGFEDLHATALFHADRALLLTGPSGSGKSALALQLLALGAGLIADDRVRLSRRGAAIIASRPATPAPSGIEARGLGLIAVPAAPAAPLALVVDLAQREEARLPPSRHLTLLGQPCPLIYKADGPHFAAGLLLLLAHGPLEP